MNNVQAKSSPFHILAGKVQPIANGKRASKVQPISHEKCAVKSRPFLMISAVKNSRTAGRIVMVGIEMVWGCVGHT
jgi:hypothetical protein